MNTDQWQFEFELNNMIEEYEAQRLIFVVCKKSEKQYRQLINKQRKEFDKFISNNKYARSLK